MEPGFPGAALFCFVMAAWATVFALVPHLRRKWRWGRGGAGAPISGLGWAGIVLAFLLIGVALATANRGWVDPFLTLLLALGGVATFVAAGVYDTVRHSEEQRKQ